MRVRLRLFANAKDLAGFDDRTVELSDDARAAEVLEYLSRSNPEFLEWRKSLRVAVNRRYVSDDYVLKENDEVAVIPPVSGG
ncbi:MAG: molybdopterin converting factor subunit 1 [Ignavibacterium sp.]|jgi:molybdopterin converting factor subunit 1